MNIQRQDTYPPYVKTIIILTKDLGFPVLVSGILFYAIWHFGSILVNDHLDLIHSLKANNEKQAQTISYLVDSDKESKRVLDTLMANQSLIIDSIKAQTIILTKLTDFSIRTSEREKTAPPH